MSGDIFAPPRASLDVREGPEALWEMSFKDVRKLYFASVNVHALGVLYALGALGVLASGGFMLVDASSATKPPPGGIALMLGIGVVMLAACVSSYTRPKWGRVLGMILCAMSLLNIPFGTAIGILGLIAYTQGGKLFGAERLLHKDVAAVYKQRKADKK